MKTNNTSCFLEGSNLRKTFEFHFIGPINEVQHVKADQIHYHGRVTNEALLKAHLDDCDVLVCPSYAEGMPNVIMEGMSRGLAIIATDVGAVSEVVGQDNGRLLSHASVNAIFSALIEFVSMPDELLYGMKLRSLDKIRAFTWEAVGKRTVAAISEICSHK